MKKLKSILLVDDDPSTNFLHSFYIEEWGLTENIHIALNGQEALDFLKTNESFKINKPSLILLDINMPVMNGFEFLEAYEHLDDSFKATTVVAMLTSSLHASDQEKAKNQKELKGFLNKPLSKENLEELIANMEVSTPIT